VYKAFWGRILTKRLMRTVPLIVSPIVTLMVVFWDWPMWLNPEQMVEYVQELSTLG
jgi:hypothetical protein